MAGKRNKIVHGYAIKTPVAPGVLPIDANAEMDYFVGPGFTKSLFDPIERHKFRNVRQLKQLACAFDLLAVRISKFSQALSVAPGYQPGAVVEFVEQPK